MKVNILTHVQVGFRFVSHTNIKTRGLLMQNKPLNSIISMERLCNFNNQTSDCHKQAYANPQTNHLSLALAGALFKSLCGISFRKLLIFSVYPKYWQQILLHTVLRTLIIYTPIRMFFRFFCTYMTKVIYSHTINIYL